MMKISLDAHSTIAILNDWTAAWSLAQTIFPDDENFL